MKFRLLSDLHFEFCRYHTIQPLPHLYDESNMIVILAGDVFQYSFNISDPDSKMVLEFHAWLKDVCLRHKHVIYVCGNHEFYKGDICLTISQLKQDYESKYHNLTVLENDHIVIDDVAIIGATLWTNYFDEMPINMWNCQVKMADYRAISNKLGPQSPYSSKISTIIPSDILPIHYKSKSYIFDTIKDCKSKNLKTVVVTHHAPSALSITEEYATDLCNSGYVNEYSEQLLDNQGPIVWCHGHVHSSHDYILGITRVIANPHGIGDENSKNNRDKWQLYYKPDFVFEV